MLPGNSPVLLKLTGISKSFAGSKALDGVDLEVRAGELHVLFGENGAGKSTLINIIAGTFSPDAGTVVYSGETLKGLTPLKARALGISPVFQEFSLVPHLTVEENLFLGREMSTGMVMRNGAMRRRAKSLLAELDFGLDPKARVVDLSRGHQQMVEIAKALLGRVQLLILDEPTASLTERETSKLFQLISRLKSDGVGIIYVSHRMKEIRSLAERITVLRDGRLIKTVDAASSTDAQLVELMTGRKIDVLYPSIDHRPSRPVLELHGLTLQNGMVDHVDLHARAGEITGIAGLVGCGKSEVIRAIYGLETIKRGSILVDGETYAAPNARASLKRGVVYFPADRVAEGLGLSRPVRENVSMAAMDLKKFSAYGFVRRASERSLVSNIVKRLQLRPPKIEKPVASLSGGNRQKVMLARALTRDISLFLFDEPSVGIDVGAKLEVYEFMKGLAEQGAAVVVVSSELPEVLALSNRLYVMHNGRVVAELAGEEKSEQAVLKSIFNNSQAGSHVA